MAQSYKVPQDVEAEDKLIGPFSFRQFIYLGIVAMACGAGWGLFLLFKPLVVIPIPLVIFFSALALPLRKDQPMETYLAAMWQFYIKPRRRMWMADGIVSRITIDIPLVAERRLTKDITTDQALSQFDYLSQIADSGGWSTRGVTHAPVAVVDNPADDILDGTSMVAQNFNARLEQQDTERHEDLLARIHSGQITASASVQPVIPQSAQSYVVPAGTASDPTAPTYDPTPRYMHQHIIQPLVEGHSQPSYDYIPGQTIAPEPAPQQPVEQPQNIATPAQIDAIMELAKGVSVETVAKQLHHEEVERTADGEVVINLH